MHESRPFIAAAALAGVLATTPVVAQPIVADEPEDDGTIHEGTIDPMVPGGVATLVLGSGFAIAGAASIPVAREAEACGLSGCTTYSAQEGSPGSMLLAGGAVTGSGGALMLLAAAAAPPEQPSAGRARAASGGTGLAVGAGAVTMGVVGQGDLGGRGATGLIIAGASASAVSLPVLVWGLATLDEAHPSDRYASDGAITLGTTLIAGGTALTAGGAALVGTGMECNGSLSNMCGLHVVLGMPVLILGLGAAGAGIGIDVAGADLGPRAVLPAIVVGPGTVDATWSLR